MADQESTHVYNEILEEGVMSQACKLDQLPGDYITQSETGSDVQTSGCDDDYLRPVGDEAHHGHHIDDKTVTVAAEGQHSNSDVYLVLEGDGTARYKPGDYKDSSTAAQERTEPFDQRLAPQPAQPACYKRKFCCPSPKMTTGVILLMIILLSVVLHYIVFQRRSDISDSEHNIHNMYSCRRQNTFITKLY